MSSEQFFAAIAAAWVFVLAAPFLVEKLEQWLADHERRIAEIRAAEELADRQFKKAIASLRSAREPAR